MLALILALPAAVGGASRTLPAAGFHAIDLATHATVRIVTAPVAAIVATGDPRLVRCVTAEVRDGRLVIGWAGRGATDGARPGDGDGIVVAARADCGRPGDPRSLTVRVAAPAIDAVSIGGEGTVTVAPMRFATFAASVPGRGSIAIDGLRAGATRLSIAGSGRIAATGDVGRLTVAIAGSGMVDARDARAAAIDVSIGGRGDVAATVDGPATGAIAGSGTVAIGGHPACAIRNPGGGRIACPASARAGGGA